MTKLFLVN